MNQAHKVAKATALARFKKLVGSFSMVSTFINPVVNPDRPLGLSAFIETAAIRSWPSQSADEADRIVTAVYKQILSNAYVMESERQQVPESQFKRGDLSVIEFIRQVAKSDLYKSRFFENGTRNRFIELNFKHFLGRAPESRAEIATHSAILDSQGYEAEIDSYLDSDEYHQAFGTNIVPHYRGYKTEASTPIGFTHTLALLRGASSSDKHVTTNNSARLPQTLFADKASAIYPPTGAISRRSLGAAQSVDDLLRNVFSQPSPNSAPSDNRQATVTNADSGAGRSALKATAGSQAEQIEQLTQQLNELRSLSNMGAAILRKGQRPTQATGEDAFGSGNTALQDKVMSQAAQIEKLQGELMTARSLSNIAEFKLNKWRSRSY